ncbi:MAG: hypothetical protein SGI89_08950 [bacterium]|nr:hypothetical protein [bacterium]
MSFPISKTKNFEEYMTAVFFKENPEFSIDDYEDENEIMGELEDWMSELDFSEICIYVEKYIEEVL